MPLLVIDIVGGKRAILGQLGRRLLELRAGLFVGKMSTRNMNVLWEAVKRSNPKGVMLLHAARNENGFLAEMAGECKFSITLTDGLQLLTVRKTHRKNRMEV